MLYSLRIQKRFSGKEVNRRFILDIQSAYNSGLYGLAQAEQGINKNAQDIANNSLRQSNNEELNAQANNAAQNAANAEQAQTELNHQSQQSQTELTDNLVDLNVNQLQAGANIKTLQTANEVIGSIIDIKV